MLGGQSTRRAASLAALSRASCAASGILHQVTEATDLAVRVGDRKRFEMTYRSNRADTRARARARTQCGTRYVHRHAKCCGGSDLDTVSKWGKVRTGWMEEEEKEERTKERISAVTRRVRTLNFEWGLK